VDNSTTIDDPAWDDFRRQMPVAGEWAYFDHAAVAPLCGPAKTALDEWAADVSSNGAAHWSRWRKRVEELRTLAAQLTGAQREEIAVIRNTTEGVNLVAEGFPWRPGDNVVTLDSEFPTNLYPWRNLERLGVETRLVPTENERVDPNRVAALCDGRTRIVSVSWVGYATGWRNDLDAMADIAHHRGAKLFVDAIQGLGVFPLDVSRTPVDFLAADGHKWLLGPEGAGLFYLRREHLGLLRPVGVGWNSVVHAGDFTNRDLELKDSAARYEGGSYNMAGVAALAAAVEWLTSFGTERLSARLLAVSDRLCARLAECGAEIASAREDKRRSGIVACTFPQESPERLRGRCLAEKVLVNCRAERLRLSPHVYTNEADLDRLIACLK
jgi:selenocysteine lyase/cysteine desulfurase